MPIAWKSEFERQESSKTYKSTMDAAMATDPITVDARTIGGKFHFRGVGDRFVVSYPTDNYPPSASRVTSNRSKTRMEKNVGQQPSLTFPDASKSGKSCGSRNGRKSIDSTKIVRET